MMTNRGQEFEIKIAKAKDLPPSWFDLVLRPDAFKQHLKTLETNPNVEPTGLQLVATFLEKGGVLEGQTPLPPLDSGGGGGGEGGGKGGEGGVIEERRRRLVNCALFIGSFLHWDLALFEKSLLPAVAYSLLVQLTKYHPLSKPPSDETNSSHFSNEAPPTLTAHVLYCHWVLRYLNLSHLPPDVRRATNSWDITCASPEQIKTILEPQLSHCVGFLEEVSREARGYCSPSVTVSLPVPGRHGQDGESVELSIPSAGRDVPVPEMLCQLHYSLGSHYFWRDNFKRAHSCFKQSRLCLASLSSCPPVVDAAQLHGFVRACQVMRAKVRRKTDVTVGTGGEATLLWEEEKSEPEKDGDEEEEEEDDGGDEEKTLLDRLERCRVSDPESVPHLLVQDLRSPSLPPPTCTALQRELARLADDTSPEPRPKRVKLDPNSPAFSAIPLHTRVCVCNAVRAVVDGQPVQPPFWKLFSHSELDSNLYHFLFHVCYEAVQHYGGNSEETRTLRLQTFVRSVCCMSSQPRKVWDFLLQSKAKSLVTDKDSQVVHSFFPQASVPLKPTPTALPSSSAFSSAALSSALYERQILCASSCQELLCAVDQCFKALPTSEHKSLAQKWVGSGDEFMTFDLMSDPVLLTKYNAMVHKAHQLKRAQSFNESVRFLRAALGLIPKPSVVHSKSSSSPHSKPDKILLDQILWAELKGAALETKTRPSQEEGPVVAKGLIEKAKSFCKRSYTLYPEPLDAMTVCLAAAFLLNTHSYQHLAALEHPFSPGKVAPRLAVAAQTVGEGRDARKSIRDLFGAVLSVFSTPVTSSSETRSEVEHKQQQLRSQFDVLVDNLEDPTSLSLLLMALTRIWSILKKPEEEIQLQSELSMYWPTVIGSPGSVNTEHVFRALSSTLHHSLSTHPYNESWMMIQAEVHYATAKYGAALLSYLKAGAVTSLHFENEVPLSVWPAQAYRKIINCCSRLNLHTHAVLLCQLLVPVDYELAFSILSNHSSSMVESLFSYFWDMVIIEYLIYINAKRGDKYKQDVAVQIAGQPELNCNNSQEVLCRAAEVRRRKLLRSFYQQSFSTL